MSKFFSLISLSILATMVIATPSARAAVAISAFSTTGNGWVKINNSGPTALDLTSLRLETPLLSVSGSTTGLALGNLATIPGVSTTSVPVGGSIIYFYPASTLRVAGGIIRLVASSTGATTSAITYGDISLPGVTTMASVGTTPTLAIYGPVPGETLSRHNTILFQNTSNQPAECTAEPVVSSVNWLGCNSGSTFGLSVGGFNTNDDGPFTLSVGFFEDGEHTNVASLAGLVKDTIGPLPVSAALASTTTITLVFNSALDPASVLPAFFIVTNNGQNYPVATTTVNNETVSLSLQSVLPTDAAPTVQINQIEAGQIKDLFGNPFEDEQTFNLTDTLLPQLLTAEALTPTTIKLTFSESLAQSGSGRPQASSFQVWTRKDGVDYVLPITNVIYGTTEMALQLGSPIVQGAEIHFLIRHNTLTDVAGNYFDTTSNYLTRPTDRIVWVSGGGAGAGAGGDGGGGAATTPVITINGQVLGASTFRFYRTLTQGQKGSDVVELQERLKQEGFFKVMVSGYFGPSTAAAVKKYQAKYHLATTGFVGPLTLEKLNGERSATTSPMTNQERLAKLAKLQALLAQIMALLASMRH